MKSSANLFYLKGFFEACSGTGKPITIEQDKIADILDRINAAIDEAKKTPQVIPAIQPIQMPLFPQVPFTPYKPQPGTIPFYPVQPTITPNDLPSYPQWPGISDEDKYRWIDNSRKTTCETIGVGYGVKGDPVCSIGTERHNMKYDNVPMPDFSPLNSIPDPFEPDVSAGSTTEISGMGIVNQKCFDIMESYQDPLPTVSAEKLAAIMRDETRAQKLEERRARSDERTKNWNRPEPGRARD